MMFNETWHVMVYIIVRIGFLNVNGVCLDDNSDARRRTNEVERK